MRSVAVTLEDIEPTHGAVNRPLVEAMGRAGLLRGLFGGAPGESPRDAAAMQLCLLREMLATVNTEAETALALQGLGAYPILQSGNVVTRDRWIPGVASGDVVPAFALSEPDAGSDAGALSLEARPDGDGWTLHGDKTWISNAPDADVYSVFARTTPGTGARGVSAFAVAGRRCRASRVSVSTCSPPMRSARSTSTASASSGGRSARRGRPGLRSRDADPGPVPPQRRRLRRRHGSGRPRRQPWPGPGNASSSAAS